MGGVVFSISEVVYLKPIVVVPAPPPDSARNSREVKKYRKIEKKDCCTDTFFTPYCRARHLVARLEQLRWLVNDDALNNGIQLEINLLLLHVPWPLVLNIFK
jgi:hypothetical protein